MTNAPVTVVEIDCLATARRILSSPTAVYSATPFEIVAMAACTVRESVGEEPALPVIGDPPPEVLPASVAAAVANLIKAVANGSDRGQLRVLGSFPTAIEDAFTTLKTRFEKEFPHG